MIQVWDASDDDFVGRMDKYTNLTATLRLSEAGNFAALAPYASWRDLMEVVPAFHHARVYDNDGEVMHGIWLTRDDNPSAALGEMELAGNDLLEELRFPCLPPDFYISHYSAVEAMSWLLQQSDTDWTIGSIANAVDANVSVNLGGESYLAAILSLAELSGNYIRHDGITRSLDVFATPFTVAAYLRGLEPSDDALPSNVGRIMSPISLTMDTGSVLRGVYPSGGSVIDKEGNESTLRPTGDEDLQEGFSFERIRGQLAVTNDGVTTGLIRQVEYSEIEPLSNRVVSMRGSVEGAGNGWIRCEAVRRPNDNFWTGGILEHGDNEYTVDTHIGDVITGSWGTLTVGAPFKIEKNYKYDADAEDDARQDLVDAACGLLRGRAEASQQLNVPVHGLSTRVKPGDKVRLEWVAAVQTRDLMTNELERFLLESFYGDMIVASVEYNIGATTIVTLGLVKGLELLPTDSGMREMRELIPTKRKHANNRIMGVVSENEPTQTWPGMFWVDTSTEDA